MFYEAVEDSREEEMTFPSCNIYSTSFTNRHFIDCADANGHNVPVCVFIAIVEFLSKFSQLFTAWRIS